MSKYVPFCLAALSTQYLPQKPLSTLQEHERDLERVKSQQHENKRSSFKVSFRSLSVVPLKETMTVFSFSLTNTKLNNMK